MFNVVFIDDEFLLCFIIIKDWDMSLMVID